MDPNELRQWTRIFRDFVLVIIGTFMLVYETVFAKEVNWELIAAALTCFGLPPGLRLYLDKDEEKKDD